MILEAEAKAIMDSMIHAAVAEVEAEHFIQYVQADEVLWQEDMISGCKGIRLTGDKSIYRIWRHRGGYVVVD